MRVIKTRWRIIMAIIFGVLITIGFAHSKTEAVSPSQGSGSDFSATLAFDHVKYLAEKIGPRPAGSKGELRAAQYIAYVLSQNGWKVREQPFSKVIFHNASLNDPKQCVELVNSQNIIAELPGTLPDTIVLGAHYDTATMNVPGAVDNASGVGVLLELARVLSKEPHQKTYQLVFFGAEENGLVGSNYYISQADLSAVQWMLNVDMVGTPLEIDGAGKKSAPPELIKQVSALARKSHIPYHLSRDFTIMTRESTQGGSSDFSPFLDQGIPALGLGIYGRPAGYFHRPEDRLDHVTLETMQTEGDFVHSLVHEVKLNKLGPQIWDELYLSFQLGSYVLVLPSSMLRGCIIAVLLLTVIIVYRLLKNSKNKLSWKKILSSYGVILLLSIIIVGFSGCGEILWQIIKHQQMIYYAHPEWYLIARGGITICLIFFLASWLHKLPISREPWLYWLTAGILLLILSLSLALIRIDLAFPFVFWLLCLDLLYYFPNILLLVIGPYFLYSIHYELLNSEQWLNFCEAIYKYPAIFLAIYALLLVPFLLACCYIGLIKSALAKKSLPHLRMPALIGMGLLVLCLGLVPSFTPKYPQAVTVSEEWSGEKEGKIHIFSDEPLPSYLIKDLGGKGGKSVDVPLQNNKPPLSVTASVEEKNLDAQRILDVSLKLNYLQEPYIVKLDLESDQPFEVKTDEFLPMSKLPKKIQLKGVQQPLGKYSLIIQRTPPQKNTIHLTVETKGFLTCSVEGIFPCLTPQVQIQNEKLSIDYQRLFKENYTF
ncbi:putative aminopeptidase [Desulfosporosinus acidiphilus SJ4]|uniref:Putative aminopeptidase n=1 Tax=Desulfosporosinus acidiphilus (strain DSM 22704 / JCM 16185 / SJ4) TaxID=646529 RepID=I4D859_DESAJ|nr:M28 family peptidase [Desulfosporosinus acidiphilus]AFM41983.1 putative aminopeptidase [Desulfosporosinus acidiphilus SJ4]